MQPTQEKIKETVQEVMSQGQFQFDDPQKLEINLPPSFGYVILALILGTLLFFLFVFVKDRVRRPKNKSKLQPVTHEKKLPLPSRPIEKLHAEMLNSLHNRKIISLQKWKTNGDYIYESENPLFQKVCILYDASVYGAKAVSDTSVSLLNEEFAAWERQK